MSVDHKAEAERLLEQSSKSTGDPTVWLLAAQAEATLALVEQQRIANELRAAELMTDKPWLRSEIERLGLAND